MASRSGRVRITVKVGVDLPDHERLLRFPRGTERAKALGLWSAANCAVRKGEKDGYCPVEWLGGYWNEALAKKLVDVGLFAFEQHDGLRCVRVVNYEEFNETREEIEARLKANAERQEKWRKDHPKQHSNSSRNALRKGPVTGKEQEQVDLSLVEPEIDPGEALAGPRPRSTDDGACGLATTAWSDGVRSVTGAAVGPRPGRFELETLAGAIRDHADEGEDPVEWARRAGVAYATANRGRTLGAAGFERWLSSGGYVPPPAPASEPRELGGIGPGQPEAEGGVTFAQFSGGKHLSFDDFVRDAAVVTTGRRGVA